MNSDSYHHDDWSSRIETDDNDYNPYGWVYLRSPPRRDHRLHNVPSELGALFTY